MTKKIDPMTIKTITENIFTGEVHIRYSQKSKEFSDRMSQINKGRNYSEETKKHMRESHKDIPLSEEHKKSLSKAMIGKNKGKIHSEETRRKQSKSHIGLIKSEETIRKLKEARKKQKIIHSEETRRKISETNKKIMNNENFKEECRIRRAKQKDTFKSKPEIEVQKYLMKQEISFETHKIIKGLLSPPYQYHQWDIVLEDKKILIEVQGCRWHWCKICNPNSNPIDHRILDNVKRDKIIFEEAQNKGWKVIEIWEHTIKNSEIKFKI